MCYLALPLVIVSLLSSSCVSRASSLLDSSLSFRNLPDDVCEKILSLAITEPKDVLRFSLVENSLRQSVKYWLKKQPYFKLLAETHDDHLSSLSFESKEIPSTSNIFSEILEVEDFFLSQFLLQQEQELLTTDEWQAHVVAVIFAFHATRRVILESSSAAARLNYGFDTDKTDERSCMVSSPWVNGGQVIDASIKTLTVNTSLNSALNQATNKARGEACSDAFKSAMDVVKEVMGSVAYHAHLDCKKVSSIAYQMAQLKSWIKVLNPQKRVFERAYQKAYLKIRQDSIEVLNDRWFASKKVFDSQVQQLFIDPRMFDASSKILIQSLVNQLKRIGGQGLLFEKK